MLDEGRADAHRAEQVGLQQAHCLFVVEVPGSRIVERHDAGIVDDHVQCRMAADHILGHLLYLLRIIDVQAHCIDARVGLGDFIQQCLTAPRNDHFIATLVECLGQGAADA